MQPNQRHSTEPAPSRSHSRLEQESSDAEDSSQTSTGTDDVTASGVVRSLAGGCASAGVTRSRSGGRGLLGRDGGGDVGGRDNGGAAGALDRVGGQGDGGGALVALGHGLGDERAGDGVGAVGESDVAGLRGKISGNSLIENDGMDGNGCLF